MRVIPQPLSKVCSSAVTLSLSSFAALTVVDLGFSALCKHDLPTARSLTQGLNRNLLPRYAITRGCPSCPFEGFSKDVSGCSTTPYDISFLVRNEEAGGSNPLSSTNVFNDFATLLTPLDLRLCHHCVITLCRQPFGRRTLSLDPRDRLGTEPGVAGRPGRC